MSLQLEGEKLTFVLESPNSSESNEDQRFVVHMYRLSLQPLTIPIPPITPVALLLSSNFESINSQFLVRAENEQ